VVPYEITLPRKQGLMPQLWARVAMKLAQNRRDREPQRLARGCDGVAEPSTSFGECRTRIVC